MKDGYFICGPGKVVLIDLHHDTIKASSFRLRLYFSLSRFTCKELKPDNKQYKRVLDKYHHLLDELVLPHRYGIANMPKLN